MGRQKKKLSDFDENGTNRLETIKSGANLFSDQKVDFLKNWVSVAGARLVYTLTLKPWNQGSGMKSGLRSHKIDVAGTASVSIF